MKKVESAVANLINGKLVTNRYSIVNAESLTSTKRLLLSFGNNTFMHGETEKNSEKIGVWLLRKVY